MEVYNLFDWIAVFFPIGLEELRKIKLSVENKTPRSLEIDFCLLPTRHFLQLSQPQEQSECIEQKPQQSFVFLQCLCN